MRGVHRRTEWGNGYAGSAGNGECAMSYGFEGFGGGFADPLVDGNGKLIIPAVQSPNFVEGSSGWSIEQNGNAEFNDVVFRGTLEGTEVIFNSAGVFFYNGVPAAGNLIGSWAVTGGHDQFGNAFNPGLLTYYPSGAVALISSFPFTGDGAELGVYSDTALGNVGNIFTGTGWSGNPAIGWISAVATLTTGTVESDMALNTAGGWFGDNHAAYQPGTFNPETWHVVTSFGTNFGPHATDQAPRFRAEPVGQGGMVRLDGCVATTASVTSGATMFSVGTAYAPKQRKRFTGVNNISGFTAGGTLVMVDTSGNVTIGLDASGSGNQIVLDGMSWPLD